MRGLVALVFALCITHAFADVYMHNPRGSNNRYRGDTNNQNRLFDSQNNAQGGYGWGPEMTYYEGSLLQIEWTSQHGCGVDHPNVDCEIIFQYMCGPWIRDGTTDQQPPSNIDELPEADQLQYGYHEPVGYFRDCSTRRRNQGLFIATQNLGGNSDATRTRQNEGGRNGFECDEERDYYPYWHPSPWRDIAILTSGPLSTRCKYYSDNSQNTNPKYHCVDPNIQTPTINYNQPATIVDIWGRSMQYNNEDDCVRNNAVWEKVEPWGIENPECIKHVLQRDNHLGNVDLGAMTARYTWVIPTVPYDDPEATAEEKKATCVLRMRYNVSSEDYLGWANVDDSNAPMIDSEFNGDKSPVKNDPTLPYGYDEKGYLRNLTFAVDTSQFGRTFQDRSHSFFIKPRPNGVLSSAKIYNLNVRGRRGNIVQAYPAVEYDFTPNNLQVALGDFIHFQWTGSDTNNGNAAGNGRAGTDRSNIVQIKDNNGKRRRNLPVDFEDISMFDPVTAFRLAHLDQGPVCNTTAEAATIGCCMTPEQLTEAGGDRTQNIYNCQLLNYANPYFSALVQMNNQGEFHYMSSRNNDFTNRSHKGTIEVTTLLETTAIVIVVIGSAGFLVAAVLTIGIWYSKTHATSSAANIFNGIRV